MMIIISFFYLSGFNSHKKCGACFTKLYILPLNFIAFYLLLDSSFHYPKTMKTIPSEWLSVKNTAIQCWENQFQQGTQISLSSKRWRWSRHFVGNWITLFFFHNVLVKFSIPFWLNKCCGAVLQWWCHLPICDEQQNLRKRVGIIH